MSAQRRFTCQDQDLWLTRGIACPRLFLIDQYFKNIGFSTSRWDFYPTEEELETVKEIFNNDFKIPLNFTQTAEVFQPRPNYNRGAVQAKQQINPQTTLLCEKLGIDDPVEKLIGKPVILTAPVVNPDEIDLDDEEDDATEGKEDQQPPVDGNDIFFVDTKPQRSKMSLPQPVQAAEEPDVAQEASAPLDVPIPENKEEIPTEEEQPIVKKFRRRNEALYTQHDECWSQSCIRLVLFLPSINKHKLYIYCLIFQKRLSILRGRCLKQINAQVTIISNLLSKLSHQLFYSVVRSFKQFPVR